MQQKSDCEVGVETKIINRGVFDKETSMCRKLNQKNGGKCNWGECKNCGVIPLLHKLYKGEILEKPEEVEEAKRRIFNS